MSELEQLGTSEDMARRSELVRIDDETHQQKVQIARNLILVKNHAISSDAVEAQLKDTSATPTAVSKIHSLVHEYLLTLDSRTHFPKGWHLSASTSIPHLL